MLLSPMIPGIISRTQIAQYALFADDTWYHFMGLRLHNMVLSPKILGIIPAAQIILHALVSNDFQHHSRGSDYPICSQHQRLTFIFVNIYRLCLFQIQYVHQLLNHVTKISGYLVSKSVLFFSQTACQPRPEKQANSAFIQQLQQNSGLRTFQR